MPKKFQKKTPGLAATDRVRLLQNKGISVIPLVNRLLKEGINVVVTDSRNLEDSLLVYPAHEEKPVYGYWDAPYGLCSRLTHV